MHRGTKAWLVTEALVLGTPVTLLTLFYLPWNLMYAGLILVGSLANPLEGIITIWASLFFLSGPLAVAAYWWIAWKATAGKIPPSRGVHAASCVVIISACCLFFTISGGIPSLKLTLPIVIAPLLGWIHFSVIIHHARRPPPLTDVAPVD